MVKYVYWQGLPLHELVSELRRSTEKDQDYSVEDRLALMAVALARLIEGQLDMTVDMPAPNVVAVRASQFENRDAGN